MYRTMLGLAAGIAFAAVAAFAEERRGGLAKTDVAVGQDIARLLRAQISCWNPPVESGRVDSPIMTAHSPVNRVNTGSSPSQAPAKAALLAVRRCQHFKLPAARYELWKDVQVSFDAHPIPPP